MSDSMPFPDGAKFKAKEREMSSTLPERTFAVIRFDGKNFSTFTKRYAKPYDETFMNAMDETTRKMVASIPGAVLGYTQSDEISIVFSDLATEKTQMWFGGRVEKMLTLGAALTTARFIAESGTVDESTPPIFDARVHTLADADEVQEYVRWRRFDAQKNSVTMAAGVLFSHNQLKGVPSKERLRLLEGTEYARLPEGFYNGRVTYNESYRQPLAEVVPPEFLDMPRQDKSGTVARKRQVTVPATRAFMEEQLPGLLAL
jgi:tRNA(His) guanylyltransferase